MNINLQFNNLKELESFIKDLGYSKSIQVSTDVDLDGDIFGDIVGDIVVKDTKQVNVITKDPEPVTKKKTKAKEEPKEEPKEEVKELTLLGIRALAKKAMGIDRPATEELIRSYAPKLGEIPKDKYSEFASKVGEIIEGA